MVKKKNTIFISFSSKDIGHEGYVQAVENAIHCIGDYEADHMNTGVIDASVTQRELDERIRRSQLVIMVLGQQYKDCKNLRHEFEEVTKRGNKIKVLIFIKKYRTPEEEQEQKENIFSVLNIDENRYNRFEDSEGLRKDVENQLNRWMRAKNKERRIKSGIGYAAIAALVVLLFYLFVHYIKNSPDEIHHTSEPVVVEGTAGGKVETSHQDNGETPAGGKDKTSPGDKVRMPGSGKGEIGIDGKNCIIVPEQPVIVPNTFAVACDDELFSAGISDAVSKVLPSLSQSADTSKAQWTISVKQYTVQELPKIIGSDALQVEVYYTVDIINNANNTKSGRTITNRGRSIIQNRDDAIRNANEEATKEIANILKSM